MKRVIAVLCFVSVANINFAQVATEDINKPTKRAHHEMVFDEMSKSIIMIGGVSALPGGRSYKFLDDIWKYTSAGWSKVGKAGDERSGIRLVYDTKRMKLYSYGGYLENQQSSGQLRRLENGEWKILSDLPEMKAAESGFVYDASRDKFIAFGGSSGGVLNNITYEWDGATWKKFEGKSPQGRHGFVMAYDIKKSKTVLFGGMNSSGKILDDGVWEYDGKEWKNIKPKVSPGSRFQSGYAYDSKRSMIIIFGGTDKNGDKGDTWAWDGTSWKKLADIGPAPRSMGKMAYDKNRDRIILFGGRIGYNDTNDTWEWDGTKWEERK